MVDEVKLLANSKFFDPNWYANRFPDVLSSGMMPIEHYLLVGARLHRPPSERFDTEFYLRNNPDVVAAGINPLTHFLLHGQHEGRLPLPPSLPNVGANEATVESTTVVLVSGEAMDRAGFFYRIERAAAAFRANGYRTEIMSIQEANNALDVVKSARLLFIWRARYSHATQIYNAARAAGVPIVFDLDDLMIRPELATADYIDAIRFNNLSSEKVVEHYTDVQAAMTAADCCTASTSELAWQMRLSPRRRPTYVIPNGFDNGVYVKSRVAARSRVDDGFTRIGYASGSRTHQADFKLCVGAVARVLREHTNTLLVLFRRNDLVTLDVTEFPEMVGLEDRIEWRSFVALRDLPTEVGRFDINLAPLEAGNPFCESKSELKVFEAALCDVPTIASPTGPFKRAMLDKETGVIATTEDEWYLALKSLVADPSSRMEMGRKAHQFALWYWGPTRRAEVFRSLIDQIKPGRAASRAAHFMTTERPTQPAPFRKRRLVAEYDKKLPSKVSVIIPLFNYEKFVIDAMASVHEQNMKELDLIVIDDGSTDASLEKVLEWSNANHNRFNRLIVAQHLNNEGLGAARNTGFDLADTLHVMALDADNLLRPKCCSTLLDRIIKEAAAFAYPTIQAFGDGRNQMGAAAYLPASLEPGNYIDAMALISKEAWAHVGGYSEKRKGWQDFEFWCKLRDRGLHGIHVNEILAEYRIHQHSMLRTATDKAKNKGELVDELEATYSWLALIDEREGYRKPKQADPTL